MQAFVLGLAALAVGLALIQWFTRASPAHMAVNIKRLSIACAAAIAIGFALRGSWTAALPAAAFAAWLIVEFFGFRIGGRGQPRSAGQTSRIVTEYLDMELDHDSGSVTGTVLKGLFQGRRIASLAPEELALLWQDCRLGDMQSAQIIEAYLDRVQPSWREDLARGEKRMASGPDGRMGADEAYEILGLAPGATREEIRKAHRELMLKLHPDRGGSTYLAAKVNEAKDVLLDLTP